jgi:hypothetical protein
LAVLAAAYGLALAADTPTTGPTTKPADKNANEAVVRLLQAAKQGAAVLHVGQPVGPGAMDILIPPTTDPDPVLIDLLLNAKPGSLLDVKTKMVAGKPTLLSAAAYKMRAGEDEPNVYAVVQRTTCRYMGADVPAIDAAKFLKPTQLMLPVTKDKDGKATPNADMVRTLDTVKDTDSVEVQTLPSPVKPGVLILKSLKVYVPWERAQFSKLTKKTFQGDDYTALEVQPGSGDAIQLLMSAKDEAPLTVVVSKIKHGQDLLYRSKSMNDVTWVTEVKPVTVASNNNGNGWNGGGGAGTGSGTGNGTGPGTGSGWGSGTGGGTGGGGGGGHGGGHHR